MKNQIHGRIKKLEDHLTPETETAVILPTIEPGYVACLLRRGKEILLTQEEYDQYCREHAATMRAIKPRADED